MSVLSAMTLAGAGLAVDDDKVTPGIVGFLVVFALGLATWALIRSLNRQLRKVDFPEQVEPPGQAPRRGAEGSSDPDNTEGTLPPV